MSTDERTLAERVASMLVGMAAADSLHFEEIDAVAALLREQQARIAELERDLEAARVDVIRMDFIHKSVNYIDMYMDAAIVLWGDDEGRAHSIENGNLRAAIDLARARGEG